jgi:hypothetical protein
VSPRGVPVLGSKGWIRKSSCGGEWFRFTWES